MLKVLIVDDEIYQRNVLAKIVKQHSLEFIVYEAENGLEALEVILSENIDILITDIRMPKMTGMELLEELGEKLSSLKVLILSGYPEFEYAQKAIKYGVFDYILKPIDEDDICVTIEKVYQRIMEEKPQNQNKDIKNISHEFYMDGGICSFGELTNIYIGKLYENKELIDCINCKKIDDAVFIIKEKIIKTVNNNPNPVELLDLLYHAFYRLTVRYESIIAEHELKTLLVKIKTLLSVEESGNLDILKTNASELIMELIELISKSKIVKNEVYFENCLNYINHNLGENISLESVAEHFFFNPSYFSVLFKKNTSKTFSEYVTEIRMKHAKTQILDTNKKIYQISLESGYKDNKYFCRIFKSYHGMTPEQMRKWTTTE